jgi:hypothetical protein
MAARRDCFGDLSEADRFAAVAIFRIVELGA